MQLEVARENLFTMRLSDEEQTRLEGVATSLNLTAAGVIRMLVKREADEIERRRVVPIPAPVETRPAAFPTPPVPQPLIAAETTAPRQKRRAKRTTRLKK